MKISVIIPTYNRARLLKDALESVARQTMPPDEIIVVDDGSTDNTKEVVESVSLSSIKYIRIDNSGPSTARNVGIQHAKGDLIAFLDSDDLWLPSKLEIQLNYFREQNNIDMLFTEFAHIDENGKKIGALNRERNKASGRLFAKCFLDGVPTLLSTVLIKKTTLFDVRGFDEKLKKLEDFDLWLRISLRHSIGLMNEPLTLYRLHSQHLSNDRPDVWKWAIRAYLKNEPALKKAGLDIKFYRSKYYSIYSQALLIEGQRRKAIKWAAKALITAPTVLSRYSGFVKCFLPLTVVQKILVRKNTKQGQPDQLARYY